MRLLILSDLHLEFAPFEPPEVDVDAVVLAGDVHNGLKGLKWIRSQYAAVPVLYVLGNHEYYGETLPKLTDHVIALAEGTNVHVLENRGVEIGGIAFLGATLWTDMALLGDPVAGGLEAEGGMNDFRQIRTLPKYSRLRASRVRAMHADSVTWLRSQFEALRGRRFVVVTHHAPSAKSLPQEFLRHPLSPAYASSADALVSESGAAIWVHGHIHRASDYVLGGTRVIANPRGYPDQTEHGFQPGLVVEV